MNRYKLHIPRPHKYWMATGQIWVIKDAEEFKRHYTDRLKGFFKNGVRIQILDEVYPNGFRRMWRFKNIDIENSEQPMGREEEIEKYCSHE